MRIKRLIVATITDEIKYYDGILTVKLKPIFEKLRKRKEIELLKKNYRTLKIVETTTLQKENKNKKTIARLNNYRKLKRLTGIKKEPHIETLFVNGTGDGLQLEPKTDIYLDILKELTHSSTVIFDIKTILKY